MEEEPAGPPQPKFVDPYLSLPPRWVVGNIFPSHYRHLSVVFFCCSTFVLDAFKRSYSNEDTATKAIPFFWENFDKEGWSIWKAEYNCLEELKSKKVFMASNLVSGMLQRIEKLRKYAFASVLILGTDGDLRIEGVWVLRGQELAFSVSCPGVVWRFGLDVECL